MNLALIELILVAVLALGFGIWQLYDVNKAIRKDRDESDDASRDEGNG